MESPLHSDEKFRLLPLGALALVFVFAAPVFWQDVELSAATVTFAPENRDLRDYYAPVYEYAYGALRDGRIPAWDPARLCGTPLISDPRVGLFQPLNVVFLLAPFPEAFAVHGFTCLAVAGLGFVLFARSMGLSATAALFGGLCFAFSGAAAGAMSRPPFAAALAWIPIALWSASTLAKRPGIGSSIFAGLVFAGLLLSGALAIFATTVLVATAYLVVATAFPWRRNGASLGGALAGLLGALCVCTCVSAVQLFPMVQWAIQLDDPVGLVSSLLPAGTLPGSIRESAAQIAAPAPGSLPSLFNLGIVGVVFLPAAFLQRRRVLEGLFFSVAGVALLVLAAMYGSSFPSFVPPYSVVYPAMACCAAACALGADRIMRKRSGPGREWYWLGAGLVLSLCVLAFLFGSSLTRGYVTLVAAVVIALLVARRSWARAVLGLALCGLVWTNLLTSSQNVFGHPFDSGPRGNALIQRGDVSGLESGRFVLVGDSREGDPAWTEGAGRVDGFGALFTKDEAAWWRALSGHEHPRGTLSQLPDLNLLGAMAGRLILSSGEAADNDVNVRWVVSSSGYRYASNDSAVPRAQWVRRVEWVDDVAAAITSIQARNGGIAYVDSKYRNEVQLAGLNADTGSEVMDATASIQDRAPEHVIVTLRTPARGVLLLADSYSPDWHAEVDGQPSTMVRVNGLFRGVPVPEGDHIVEFHYRPNAFYVGGLVSLGTLALLMLWGLARVIR